jgi:hypothetical protein
MSSVTTIYGAVVDDDENICRSFGRLLRAAGLQPGVRIWRLGAKPVQNAA